MSIHTHARSLQACSIKMADDHEGFTLLAVFLQYSVKTLWCSVSLVIQVTLNSFRLVYSFFQIEWLLKKPFFLNVVRSHASIDCFQVCLFLFSDLLNSRVSRWGSAENRETAFCWIFLTCSLNSCASNSVSLPSSSVSSGSASLSSWSSSVASISSSSPARYLKQR